MEREFLNKKVQIIVNFGTGTIGEDNSSLLMSYAGTLMNVDEEYIKVNVTGVAIYPFAIGMIGVKLKQDMGITIFKRKNIILINEI